MSDNEQSNLNVHVDAGEAASSSKFAGLGTRVVSGALYAVVVIVCLYAGKIPTALICSLMAWLCSSEFFNMTRIGGRIANEPIGLVASALFPLAPFFPRAYLVGVLFLTLLAPAIWYLSDLRISIADVAVTVFAPLYCGLMFSSVVYIRFFDAGLPGFLLALGAIGATWVNDATAYFVGSRFGLHKLAPKISPNKSWEGFWGGIAGAVVVWIIVWLTGKTGIGLPLALCLGLLEASAAVAGDLFESRIKRGAGVKDSGNIIPGHGGMLDRSDALLFGTTIALIVLQLGGIL